MRKVVVYDWLIVFNNPLFIEKKVKLYSLPRTGWVNRGVKNPETVGDKIIAIDGKKHDDFRFMVMSVLFGDKVEIDRNGIEEEKEISSQFSVIRSPLVHP